MATSDEPADGDKSDQVVKHWLKDLHVEQSGPYSIRRPSAPREVRVLGRESVHGRVCIT